MIIGCDVDGVVADLHTRWLELYNRDFGDNLTVVDIRAWGLDEFVKPEAKKAIYGYLHKEDLYDHVRPVEGALEGVQYLRARGYRVVFVTSNVLGMTDPKWRWLVSKGFLPNTTSQPDLVVANDKGLLTGVDTLLDDRDKNVEDWQKASGRTGILFDAPYNHASVGLFRVYGWGEALEAIEELAVADADV